MAPWPGIRDWSSGRPICARKWSAPAGNPPSRGCRRRPYMPGPSVSDKRTRKPNSVYAVIPLGAALPRALISDLPGGFSNSSSRLGASGRCAAHADSWRALPSLFGLAPCGVYPATGITAGAVRSYRTFSPLPDWPSRHTPFGPTVLAEARTAGGMFSVALAVHGPRFKGDARVPDVIRHTALRSSDFPLPKPLRAPAATARSSCQRLV
jgi:hypothetical protein